jgi:hypothetical protein
LLNEFLPGMVDSITIEDIKQHTLKVLRYYDFFHYPLSSDEIYLNFPKLIDKSILCDALQQLTEEKIIYKFDTFYSLYDSYDLIDRRKKGNDLAEKKISKAYRIANFINRFPFVETVLVSGSLSKNYAEEGSDIDFFIITKPNKVWISRSILHLFKKLTFLVERQHDFCMNYFIDMDHLRLEEQNIYTAIELSTLKPYRKGDPILKKLLKNNNWIAVHLPNFYHSLQFEESVSNKNSFVSNFFMNNRLFNSINLWLMNLTDLHWKRKWKAKNFPMQEYPLAFKTKFYVSKNHPNNYQKKVLEYNKTTN